MKGKVDCRFIGGPNGEVKLTISAMACRDTLSVVGNTWLAQDRDGGIRVMKGPMPPYAPWLAFTAEVYEKVKPVMPGQVTYRFVRAEEVIRCEKILEDKGRRCRNEAERSSKFCRAHKPTE